MKEFAIMFDDLKPEIQEQLLEFYNIKSPKEGNFDVYEVALITIEDEDN